MEKNKIYLVLQHVDGGRDGKDHRACSVPVLHKMEAEYNPLSDRIHYHSADRYRLGIGDNGHDAFCHCLIVHKKTYKTREEADLEATKGNVQYPRDFFWSLEVELPD